MAGDGPDPGILADLWERLGDPRLAELLPRAWRDVAFHKARLADWLDLAPRRLEGRISPGAIVEGEIVAMGPGSVIESGAIVHESCRLYLGAGSRLRATALVRDEVVIGAGCSVGAYCEVVRSVLFENTALGHWVFVADSVVGAENMLAGAVFVANSPVRAGRTVRIATRDALWDTGTSHMGMLSGDRVRVGASTMVCPGAVLMPDLALPPAVVLHGVIDAERAEELRTGFKRDWCPFPVRPAGGG